MTEERKTKKKFSELFGIFLAPFSMLQYALPIEYILCQKLTRPNSDHRFRYFLFPLHI